MPKPKNEAQIIDSNGNIIKKVETQFNNSTLLASVVFDMVSLNNAFDKSKKDTKGFKTVKTNIPEMSGAKAYEIVLPVGFLTSGDGSKIVQIQTGLGDINVPGNLLTTKDIAGAQNVSLIITLVDKSNLDRKIQNQIGSRPIIQLSIKIDGKQIPLYNLNTPIIVVLPYTSTVMELVATEHIVVYHIDDKGNVISVPNGRYDPATGTVIFSTGYLGRYAIGYVHKTFSDLGSVEWARKAIEVMASKGIINGTGINIYSPTVKIIKADFLVLLTKTLGLTAEFKDNFVDVAPDVYYYEAVGIARKLGIVTSENNLFNYEESISRQDMALLTVKALENLGKLNTEVDTSVLEKFKDKREIADYALESMAKLVKEGLLAGSENKLYPRTPATRAEVAAFLYRIYNNYSY
ncbi:MAG: S-layer homology domain-containing protein [Peptococcales bacterium]